MIVFWSRSQSPVSPIYYGGLILKQLRYEVGNMLSFTPVMCKLQRRDLASRSSCFDSNSDILFKFLHLSLQSTHVIRMPALWTRVSRATILVLAWPITFTFNSSLSCSHCVFISVAWTSAFLSIFKSNSILCTLISRRMSSWLVSILLSASSTILSGLLRNVQ